MSIFKKNSSQKETEQDEFKTAVRNIISDSLTDEQLNRLYQKVISRGINPKEFVEVLKSGTENISPMDRIFTSEIRTDVSRDGGQ